MMLIFSQKYILSGKHRTVIPVATLQGVEELLDSTLYVYFSLDNAEHNSLITFGFTIMCRPALVPSRSLLGGVSC